MRAMPTISPLQSSALSLSPRAILAIAESPASTLRGGRLLRPALGRSRQREEGAAPISASGWRQSTRCARYQRRAKRSRSSGTSGARITFPSPAANLSLPITSRPILRKQRCSGKRPGTLENERQAIERWRDYLGHVRIDQIATPRHYRLPRQAAERRNFCGRKLQPVSERTANLDLMMLRNVLKAAMDDGHLRELPRMKMLLDEAPPPKRDLVTPAEFDCLIEAARNGCKKNGEELADYLRFLAFSGAREQEASRIKWADVDFERERVTIGADRLTKTGRAARWNLIRSWERFLRDMRARRAPDCAWLFPPPRRGPRDRTRRGVSARV